MIPLRDETRRPARFPVVTTTLIALNAACFALELVNGDAFVIRWSAVPADILAGRHLETLVTAQFMHAGWQHIIGNMIFLWAFGPEVEDAMSPARYAGYYILGGVVAMLAQVAASPASTIPNLGASGAIAAVMGAFVITFPEDRIRTLLIIGFYVNVTPIPAVFLIGFWFLTQLVSVGAIASAQSGGVAYLAHIGGLIFGAIAARLFEDKSRLAERPFA
jgi:membrane associated rhomboid family serine protease